MRPARPIYASLLPVDVLAPLVMALTGLLTIVEAALVVDSLRAGALSWLLFAFGPPTLGTTLAARGLARRSRAFACGWPLIVVLAHGTVAGALVDPSETNLVVTFVVVVWGITIVLASPMLVLAAWRGGRVRAHDAGDTFLGAAGVWWTVLHGLLFVVAPQALSITFVVASGVVGVGATVLAVVRRTARRAFCTAVVKGALPDYRVRPVQGSGEEHLPFVHGRPTVSFAVLERILPIPAGASPYRATATATPIGLVPLS